MSQINREKKKKIALVIPNLSWQESDKSVMWHIVPYNLCMLAAMFRDFCEVVIIDANAEELDETAFKNKIAESQADVVGITVMMDQFARSGHLATRLAREVLPESVIIMGGVYATINYDQAIMDSNLDYVFRGEGEYGFRDFLKYLWYGKDFPQKGLVWRKDSRNAPYHSGGPVTAQERADFIQDLNALPLPAYDLIDFKQYTLSAPRLSVDGPHEFPCARIQTSRGCPQGCCFCQVKEISGNKFRPRSPEKIVEEMLWYKNTYGVKSLIVDDDNIVTQRSRAVKLFTLMAEKVQLPWKAIAMAVFKLDEELIDLMAASGCKYMSIAIESGSRRILDEVIRKPIDFEHAKKMTAYAKSKGIFVSSNFIVGFPTETWDEIRQTCAFAEELGSDYAKIFTAIPLRHTRLWSLCEETNSFRENFSQQDISWNSGQIASPHFDTEELTLLRSYEWDRINFTKKEKQEKTAQMMNISVDELTEIRRETRRNALEHMAKK